MTSAPQQQIDGLAGRDSFSRTASRIVVGERLLETSLSTRGHIHKTMLNLVGN